jgi:hypothetical protein
VTFLDCWFGCAEGGVAATECYSGVPVWWSLFTVTGEFQIHKLRVGRRGFVVP